MIRREWSEIIVFLLVGFVGLWSINHASTITEFIIPRDYLFWLDSQPKDVLTLKVFNFSYDFTDKGGAISFFPSGNNFEFLRIRFPFFVSNKTTNVIFLRCGSYLDNCTIDKSMEVKEEFIPTGSPYSTTLKLSKFPKQIYPFEKVVIRFNNTDMTPNGIFVLAHYNLKIEGGDYALNFIPGDSFEMKPFNLYEGVKCYENRCDERDIKLIFEGDYHFFRLTAINRDSIFNRTFWLGLGASLIGSAIIMIIKSILDLFYIEENKKLMILNKLLNDQIKIDGIGKKKVEIIKNKFK